MIYMDHSATTYVRKEVLDAMLPYFTEKFGNASSIYSIGRESKNVVESAREHIAKLLGAKAQEIYFTSGGSESDNWAIKGVARALKNKGNHIITSSIEHHAVLEVCNELEKDGFEVTYLPVDENGLVKVEDVKNAIKDTTILITIMAANNEIGTVEPIAEIGKLAKEKNILFHTDAVQAVGHIPVNVDELNIDLLSASAHKFYGPKGIGILYIRKGTKIANFIRGGAQERNRRAGTENIPSIVGCEKALELAINDMDEENKRLIKLRDKLINGILEKIPYCRLNGDKAHRLPGNVNISFQYIEGESLLLWLDMNEIAASSGSACTSGSLDPSHVLLGIGLPHEIAHGSLRLSLGMENTEEEVDKVLEVLPGIVSKLRDMSPLYENIKKGGK